MSTNQPIWSTAFCTDSRRLLVDTTGVYDPELEVAQELEDEEESKFLLDRVCCPRLKVVDDCLVPFRYETSWPHPLRNYVEWFADSLGAVASYCGIPREVLRQNLCSEDALTRASAFEAIGSYHGYENLGSEPLTLTEDELNQRWAK